MYMNGKYLAGLFLFLILFISIGFFYAIGEPKPVEPINLEKEPFNPNIAVWFNVGVTENQAKDLIESFGLPRYTLSDRIVWEGKKGIDIGGMAVIEVPQGSEQDYVQRFKESNIVKTADLNIVYEPGRQNKKEEINKPLLTVGIVIAVIFVLFFIWYKFRK